MSTLVDSYSESNQDTTNNINADGLRGTGQAFTGIGGDISSCKFYLKKGGAGGNPTGNATAKLYAISGTYGSSAIPTGAALATSDNFNVATLTTSYQLIEFTFSTPYTMVANTKYFIAYEYAGGDANNTTMIGYDTSSPTHSGNWAQLSGGTWSPSADNDTCFYVYSSIVTIDSYSETNQSGGLYVYGGAGNSFIRAQSFDPSTKSYEVTSCKFNLVKSGLPVGNVTAQLFAHSGTYGTSSVGTGVALATSDNFDVSTLTTSYQLIEFTFSTPYTISANTKYVIAFFNDTELVGAERVSIGIDDSSPTHGGNLSSKADTTWAATAGSDVCFYVYGTEVVPATSGFMTCNKFW